MTRGQGFIIDHLTDRAIDFITAGDGSAENRSGDETAPWFCYVPYNTPHTPWQVPEPYWRKYQDRDLEPTTACAYAMVENIDDNVGRLLAALEASDQRQQTLVLFLTDNGANTDRWDGNMRGRKGSLHEGGTRVPLFASWPGTIPAGQTLSTPAAHIDLLPTVMELAGIESSGGPPLDGQSLARLLRTGRDPQLMERLLFTHWAGLGAVRTPRWRLVQANRRNPRWLLFDMRADPAETNDVIGQHPELAARLADAYQRWWSDVSGAGFAAIPTQIGHSEAPVVRLRGHEARLSDNGISYHGRNGWANDWISQWSDSRGSASWPIEVVRPGSYQVRIRYAAPPAAVGSPLEIAAGEQKLRWKIDQPFVSETLETRDRLGRKETTPRTWRTAKVGRIELTGAADQLTLRRLEDGPPIDIKAVELSP
jgi:arylsulfatase A